VFSLPPAGGTRSIDKKTLLNIVEKLSVDAENKI